MQLTHTNSMYYYDKSTFDKHNLKENAPVCVVLQKHVQIANQSQQSHQATHNTTQENTCMVSTNHWN